ncbi:DnaJ-domain-containing protein [Hypoxylon sp. NC1633]|nr:DnaJ-domain-containing protein [Hypoxylon sp. NC1633]
MHSPVIADDYYAILGVSRTADAETIKAAWRHLARIKHPDKNPGNPKATAEFQLLESAYSTLSDINGRRAYDKTRLASPFNTNTSNVKANRQRRPAPTATQVPAPPPAQEDSSAKESRAGTRLECLRALKAAQEADLNRARLRFGVMKWEISNLVQKAEEEAGEQETNINGSSWWASLLLKMVSTSPQKQESGDEEAKTGRRRLDWEAEQQTRLEQAMRQWEVIRSLEVDLSLTAGQIRSMVQQDAEEREREEQAMAAAAAKQRWKEVMMQQRRQQERRTRAAMAR